MKKKIFLVLLFVFFIVGCSPKKISDSNTLSGIDEKVEYTISKMTLEEKIGQMLIVSYRSDVADDNLISILESVKPGGFILFSENFKSYSQAKTFIEKVESTSDIPMFISIDQEGGRVQRLKTLSNNSVTIIPSMNVLGSTNNELLAYKVGKVVGEELRVFNINMNFAPVLDIYSNPDNTVIGDRAFGSNSEMVSRMGLSFAKGLESTGVIPVYKHFPGHGNTSEDSHYELPVITKTKEELLKEELVPFINAIEDGAKVIMIGHLAVPNITGSNVPASLSKEVITDLLKEELGFDGLVVTDALNMGALTDNYTKKEIYINAINAGVDILLMASPSKDAVKIIKEAVVNGELSEEQINNSTKKILKLKYESFQKENIYTKEYLGSDAHQEVIASIGG